MHRVKLQEMSGDLSTAIRLVDMHELEFIVPQPARSAKIK
jgi:hypothetical protein